MTTYSFLEDSLMPGCLVLLSHKLKGSKQNWLIKLWLGVLQVYLYFCPKGIKWSQIRNTKLIFHLFLDMGTDCLLFSFILHQNSSSNLMATWCITNRNISRSTTKQNSNETHQLVAQIPELTHTKNMKLSWWCKQEVLPDCIPVKKRELNFLMPLTQSQRVHSKILQADILPGFTQETCVPVPAKYNYCNRGKGHPKKWLYKKRLHRFTLREYHLRHDIS